MLMRQELLLYKPGKIVAMKGEKQVSQVTSAERRTQCAVVSLQLE